MYGDVLGALIVATSWIVGNVRSQSIAVNAVIVGILVMALGASEFLDLRRWEGENKMPSLPARRRQFTPFLS